MEVEKRSDWLENEKDKFESRQSTLESGSENTCNHPVERTMKAC